VRKKERKQRSLRISKKEGGIQVGRGSILCQRAADLKRGGKRGHPIILNIPNRKGRFLKGRGHLSKPRGEGEREKNLSAGERSIPRGRGNEGTGKNPPLSSRGKRKVLLLEGIKNTRVRVDWKKESPSSLD